LALGGTTTLLHEGHVIQTGPASEVYRNPANVEAAELFSEPPINLVDGRITESQVFISDAVHFPLVQELQDLPPGDYKFGIRPNHIGLVPQNDDDLELAVTVELSEISGSESFLHVRNKHFPLVMQLSGVYEFHTDTDVNVYLPAHRLFVFDMQGKLIKAPSPVVGGIHHG
jgi:glycerol transport system ATP-binding protein